ncbi:MAG: hypothetical protein PVH19_12370, partial [Planctomycetia bacterium]
MNVYRKKWSWLTVLVILSLTPTLGRAGEGGSKTTKEVKAPAEESGFTLLNAKEIPAGASAEVRLATARVKVDVEEKAFADEVIPQLGDAIGVPVILTFDIDEHKVWIDSDKQQFDGTVCDVSARGYLDYLFYVMNLNDKFYWSIRDGKLVIHHGDPDEYVVRKVYDVTKFFASPKQGNPVVDFDGLIELIQATIKPESWSELGGVGSIASAELAGAQVLVVRQRPDVQ